jgi:hypothetical protein
MRSFLETIEKWHRAQGRMGLERRGLNHRKYRILACFWREKDIHLSRGDVSELRLCYASPF